MTRTQTSFHPTEVGGIDHRLLLSGNINRKKSNVFGGKKNGS